MVRQIWRTRWDHEHRCRGKMYKLRLRNTRLRYTIQSPQLMNVGAVAWRMCPACGSQTHQRNDCCYKDETCKKCGKRGHMASVCSHDAGKVQKDKGYGEGNGKKGKCRRESQEARDMFVWRQGRSQEGRLFSQSCDMLELWKHC